MNTICKQYIDQVKTLFPVMGKPEKEYIRGLALQTEEICEEQEITTLETLYEEFDRPEDVVREYISTMDTEEVVQRIRRTRLLRILVTWIVIAALAVTAAAATKTVLYYIAYQKTLDSLNGYWEEEIY